MRAVQLGVTLRLHQLTLPQRILCLFLAATVTQAGCKVLRSDSARQDPGRIAEARAVRFLSREVPAWHRENGCYSCHNNGDAARALYAAIRLGYRIPPRSLSDTTAWVARPGTWEHNKGNPAFSDQRLADLQFAAALSAAVEASRVVNRVPLIEAAVRLVNRQEANGSWPVEPGNSLGSPATYGPPLATCMAILTLRSARAPGTEEAVRKAERWMRGIKPNNVPAAAAVLLAGSGNSETADPSQTAQCLQVIRRAQNPSGGYGPYPGSPSEPFDTAIALLALNGLRSQLDIVREIERGRAYLIAEQLADGSWPATTRPPGGQSYAQTISTTGWAALALMATRGTEIKR